MGLLAQVMEKAWMGLDKPLPTGFDPESLIAAVKEKAKQL
jgi:hypothetical protein